MDVDTLDGCLEALYADAIDAAAGDSGVTEVFAGLVIFVKIELVAKFKIKHNVIHSFWSHA